MRRKGHSIRDIATTIGRGVGTISDELNRNKVAGEYDSTKADHKANVRRKAAKFQGKKLVDNPTLLAFVEKALLRLQSPAAISGRLKTGRDGLPYVSKNSILRYIASAHGRRLEYQLKVLKANQNRKVRKKRPAVTSLSDRTFIDKRPSVITNRERVGDVEADFIISGKSGSGYLLTVVDRKLRYGFIRKILPVTIANMEQAFLDVKAQFPELLSITTDNDLLFAHHKRLEALLGVPIYFCDPYASWQKGSIENYNGQVRKFVPKSSDISSYPVAYLQQAETQLNERYMSIIGYLTPEECLQEYRITSKKEKSR